MDFGTLLHMAKKNSENNKNEGKYYSTKFAPPKKETKEKKLSSNIQKFLQKREEEERRKQQEERQKVATLLAMRDEKSKNKIKKMLKVTKSANKSVLDDAVNTDHTAVTMEGPEQPDQDDYGYVSNEANAFYQKYIEKVKDVKEDKGFAPSRPQSLKDLSGTKERVKAALTRETEEKKGHTRQRTVTTTSVNSVSGKDASSSVARAYSTSKPLYDPEQERQEEERKKREEEQKRAKSRKPLPPPMDFQALLKLAEKKQHEPIEILPEVKKKKEPERLLTLKEKRELEERQRAKEARERRDRERERALERGIAPASKERKENGTAQGTSTVSRMEPNGRIPKLNQTSKSATPVSVTASNKNSINSAAPIKSSTNSNGSNGLKKLNASTNPSSTSTSASVTSKSVTLSKSKTSAAPSTSTKHSNTVKPSMLAKPNASSSSSSSALPSNSKNPCSSSARDLKTIKPRQFPPADVQRTRPFPPPDVYRSGQGRPVNGKKQQAPKRRIIDDDDEDEYDSELDDFIDDGDCEEDYSSHIKAIFGYDRSKYKDLDEDDAAMESNFAQVQREEYISKKIGLQEDLEDMKLEALEKKRKMMSKKRKLHD